MPTLSCWLPPMQIDGAIPDGLRGTFFRVGPGEDRTQHFLDRPGVVASLCFSAGGVHFSTAPAGGKAGLGVATLPGASIVSDISRYLSSRLFGMPRPSWASPMNLGIAFSRGSLLASSLTGPPGVYDPYSLTAMGDKSHLPSRCCRMRDERGVTVSVSIKHAQPGQGEAKLTVVEEKAHGLSLSRVFWVGHRVCLHDFLILRYFHVFLVSPEWAGSQAWRDSKVILGFRTPLGSATYGREQPGENSLLFVPREGSKVEHPFTIPCGRDFISRFGHVCVDLLEQGYVSFTAVTHKRFRLSPRTADWAYDPKSCPGTLTVFQVRVDTRSCDVLPLSETVADSPVHNPYREGLPCRYSFARAVAPRTRSGEQTGYPFNAVAKTDSQKRSEQLWVTDGKVCDVLFVPRHDATVTASEDDGYLVVQVNSPCDGSSTSFCILDARTMNKVCSIDIPCTLPPSAHSCFARDLGVSPISKL
eukprot:Sspe_Gene.97337::Locus_70946_Transcript_1_1_Confidence_1.000_Length_1555::g.97337::m.97337/K00464/diox1; all-trans-8'-apo-beta-carotenal 15,15'-oxygenase